MQLKPISSGFILETFQNFYREIIIQRELATRSENSLGLHDLKGHTVNQGDYVALCDHIQRRLRSVLEQFSLTAHNHVGDFAASYYQEALYVLVALADEIFLSFEWPGRKRWEDHLLEISFFQTQIAGEQFFERLDALLQANDPIRNEIAICYFLAISLGFRGKYLGAENDEKIIQYQQQLYRVVEQEKPTLFSPGRQTLITSCYDHTQTIPLGRGLPDLYTWGLVFISIFCLYLFLSSAIWFHVTHELGDYIDRIMCQAQELGLS